MNDHLSPLDRLMRFFLEQKLVVVLLTAMIIAWGLLVAPFNWDFGPIPRDPVAVDAIPDIGENQQIVFTDWPGRSPQDVDDQVTYPLTVALLGLPHVKSVRCYSMFGFSSIYIIFDEDVEFYWSRSRILEKLNSLPAGTLPPGVAPALGPDATALGQVFWYTLEGRDPDGNPTGGWDPQELRSVQDWIVRYALTSAEGVAEVASIGGFVREYQIDADPDAMRAYGVTLGDVADAVRAGNLDVSARTIEVNKVEYMVRSLGFIRSLEDLASIGVAVRDDVPVLLRDIANVSTGPALRRGVLDKTGAEAVGGIVVVRYGENPLKVIENVKRKINEIAPGLPRRTLSDGTLSAVTVVPFYDRTGLIYETLGTLDSAIGQQILITIIVVLVMVLNLRGSVLISVMLPLAVLMTFIAMRLFRVDANIVALSGIAIAVGTIVDVGIVLTENIIKHIDAADPGEDRLEVVFRACREVGSAVLTAVLTTIVSFLPVFTMEGAEGKLFKPLAYTKTFALFASIIIAIGILPAAAHVLYRRPRNPRSSSLRGVLLRRIPGVAAVVLGVGAMLRIDPVLGAAITAAGLLLILKGLLPTTTELIWSIATNALAVAVVLVYLAGYWAPLGPSRGVAINLVFVTIVTGGVLLFFHLFMLGYPAMLAWALRHKLLALAMPALLVVFGATVWLGFDRVFGWLPEPVRRQSVFVSLAHEVPGLGREFMPALDEGSFLYMPTTMPHASIGEATEMLAQLDMAIAAVPEVEEVVGKLGRADSPLDPAPISMVESIIQYKSEYILDDRGRQERFRYDAAEDRFERDDDGALIPDRRGRPFRQWRDHIVTPDDIWKEITRAAEIPGVTSAPRLQPIETRIVMLQSGFRAPMGIKVFGPDLATIEVFALELERLLKEVPGVRPEAVFADRIVGKPYLEIDIDRERIARYGVSLGQVQEVIEVAIGGKALTTTVEGRERYPVRVRYPRERRDSIESLGSVLVPGMGDRQIPLAELSDIRYVRGPEMIKSEDTFLVGYVLFDKQPGWAEVDVVDAAQAYLAERIASGELKPPPGVSYRFSGSYENQLRAAARLRIVLPLSLTIIFLILYFQFRSTSTAMIVFAGVFVAWSGGFALLWLYGRPGFLDFSVFGANMRDVFQIGPVNLSVAVWVGFLALFGIATDDGVVMATRLRQSMAERPTGTVDEVRDAVLQAGRLRIRACLMTTATTVLALLPVLTSRGRGSDVMIPMAIPAFGGMLVEVLTLFVVPVLFCWMQERRLALAPALASGPDLKEGVIK